MGRKLKIGKRPKNKLNLKKHTARKEANNVVINKLDNVQSGE